MVEESSNKDEIKHVTLHQFMYADSRPHHVAGDTPGPVHFLCQAVAFGPREKLELSCVVISTQKPSASS